MLAEPRSAAEPVDSCVDLGLGRATCFARADLCCFLCVCFYWPLLVLMMTQPLRLEIKVIRENALLDPVNVSVSFVVIASLMVLICLLVGPEEARAKVGEGQVRGPASHGTMV